MEQRGKLGQDGSLLNQDPSPRPEQQGNCQERTSPVSQMFGWMNPLKWSSGGMEESKEESQQEKSLVEPTKDAKNAGWAMPRGYFCK